MNTVTRQKIIVVSAFVNLTATTWPYQWVPPSVVYGWKIAWHGFTFSSLPLLPLPSPWQSHTMACGHVPALLSAPRTSDGAELPGNYILLTFSWELCAKPIKKQIKLNALYKLLVGVLESTFSKEILIHQNTLQIYEELGRGVFSIVRRAQFRTQERAFCAIKVKDLLLRKLFQKKRQKPA